MEDKYDSLNNPFLKAIFGEREFKPMTKYGVIIPHYFVSKDGRVLSTRTKKHKLLNPKYETCVQGYISPHIIGVRVDKMECPELFEQYDYTATNTVKKSKNPNVATINIKYHRAVMEAWKPIDKYPPDRLKDCWKDIPEPAKQFIRECAMIDHEDSDTRNNHVDNLSWCTHLENQHDRKKGAGGQQRKKYEKRNGEWNY